MAGTGKRYSEQQILAILNEVSAPGAVVIEVLRRHRVTLEFIEPGEPIQNVIIETNNGRMRDELLGLHWWARSRRPARASPDIASTTMRFVRTVLSATRRGASSLGTTQQPSTRRGSHHEVAQLWGAGQS